VQAFEINEFHESIQSKIIQFNVGEFETTVETSENKFLVFSGQNNESFKIAFEALSQNVPVFRNGEPVSSGTEIIPAGSFIIELNRRSRGAMEGIFANLAVEPINIDKMLDGFSRMSMPRIALVETYLHDMDAGWTRFLFDTYGIPYTVLRPSQVKDSNLSKDFDKIVFPDMGSGAIMQGGATRGGEYFTPFFPPGYAVGIGSEGWQKVLDFIQNGGTAISWGSSIDLFTGTMSPAKPQENFRFPINNLSRNLSERGLRIPGSHLQVNLLENHPLTLGMPNQISVFQNSTNILQTSIPNLDMDRRVIARFAQDNVLLSGYADNINLIENMPALVWLQKGKGQVVLFTFNPNFRGSTPNTLKLVFNSLLINQ
jgi:hypothetical protein